MVCYHVGLYKVHGHYWGLVDCIEHYEENCMEILAHFNDLL